MSPLVDLTPEVRLYHRDQLRAARYSALADAEGFGAVCFAIEALGLRLHREKRDLGRYYDDLVPLAERSMTMTTLAEQFPTMFRRFAALYKVLKSARNDAMHSGVYARHATAAAIELCIGLEEAIMRNQQAVQDPGQELVVKDLMVKAPVVVETWQPVALARQIMLTHSFSFLPVFFDGSWKLLSEVAIVKYLRGGALRARMGTSIQGALAENLELVPANVILPDARIDDVLSTINVTTFQALWLVRGTSSPEDRLDGVLSPFELM